MKKVANIPMRTIGPVKITGKRLNAEIRVPLATYESPLWPSTHRGAQLSRLCGGIQTTLIDDRMTRSILLEGATAEDCYQTMTSLQARQTELQAQAKQTSRFVLLEDLHCQIVGNLLYVRFAFFTGDAAGHNMATKAADQLMSWILTTYPAMQYVSISGNLCTDKKASAVNGLLGRGKYVIAEITIPHDLCVKYLRATPDAIVNLNIKKNLIGTLIAGGLRSANAHFANMLLGFYLATGQDAANIIEGSQGMTHAEVKNDTLYFSVTLPNIIVGTVGNGKDLPFVQENLAMMGCSDNEAAPGENAKRLAAIAAATVLCGEISLLAAQTNPGELMRSHVMMERRNTEDTGHE